MTIGCEHVTRLERERENFPTTAEDRTSRHFLTFLVAAATRELRRDEDRNNYDMATNGYRMDSDSELILIGCK